MNAFRATLHWTPPTVDFEEQEHEIRVQGGDAITVRRVLEEKIKKIEQESGWACDMTLRPDMQICRAAGEKS